MADATWSLLRDSESQTRQRFSITSLEQELGGLRYIRQIKLGESLANSCISTDCLVDRLLLGGRRRGFTPRTSVSSSITHRCVVFVFASFFPTLQLSYFYCVILWLRVVYLFNHSLLLFFALNISQSKIYRVVIFNLGSKQLLCFHTFQSIQLVSERVHLLWFNYLSTILDPV